MGNWLTVFKLKQVPASGGYEKELFFRGALMPLQLAEAQQPPAIVERADRFAPGAPLQPARTDFRSGFVDDEITDSVVVGAGDYRGQTIA